MSDYFVELPETSEGLRTVAENAWEKDSPQAQELRTQQQTTRVLVDAVRQIEKDDAKIFPDKRE